MDYSKMTVAELREEAKKLGIKNATTLKKADLEAALNNAASAEAKETKSAEKKKTQRKASEKVEKMPETKAVEKAEKKPETKTAEKAEKKPEMKAEEKKSEIKPAEKAEKKPAEKPSDKAEKTGKPVKVNKTENKTEKKAEKPNRSEKNSRTGKTAKPEKPEKPEKHEKTEPEVKIEAAAVTEASAKTVESEKPADKPGKRKGRPAKPAKPAEEKTAEAGAAETRAFEEKRAAAEAARRAAMEAAKRLEEAARARAAAGEASNNENGRRIEKPAATDKKERFDRNDRTDRTERTDRPDRNDRNDRTDRSDRPQQSDRNRIDSKPRFNAPNPAAPGPGTTNIVNEANTAIITNAGSYGVSPEMEQLDSGDTKVGILEVMPDGFGFIRCDNYLPGEDDVYVSPAQIRRFNMKTGDIVAGNTRVKGQNEKFSALLYVKSINGIHPAEAAKRPKFEDLTPVFPYERLKLETPGCGPAMRIVDILSPIGKGQRGMIVSQPKAGKTTLLKQIAKAIITNHPEEHLIILLIDERPEEVTDMKECIKGDNVDVIYSTFDELPENHKRVSEMVMERAKRLVEHKKDVVILLDSITRLARAYNLTCTASGRTLSGGLDPAALYMPKKFFGSARKMREGGSLTILATALVDTGSRMDDVVFEEFKGTGNMELVLDRSLSERRIFPAIDLPKSGTRRDDLLLERPEQEVNFMMRRAFNSAKSEECIEKIIAGFARTQSNAEFIRDMKGKKII